MKTTTLMQMEGVLVKGDGYSPIRSGIVLYRALAAATNVVLVSDDTGPEAGVDNFLHTERLTEHNRVLFSDSVLQSCVPSQRILRQVSFLKLQRYDVALVVVSDLAMASALIEHGYNTVLYSTPAYAQPEWKPDFKDKPVPWEHLRETVFNLNKLRAEDERLQDD